MCKNPEKVAKALSNYIVEIRSGDVLTELMKTTQINACEPIQGIIVALLMRLVASDELTDVQIFLEAYTRSHAPHLKHELSKDSLEAVKKMAESSLQKSKLLDEIKKGAGKQIKDITKRQHAGEN